MRTWQREEHTLDMRIIRDIALMAKLYHLLALSDHDFVHPLLSPALIVSDSLSLSLPASPAINLSARFAKTDFPWR